MAYQKLNLLELIGVLVCLELVTKEVRDFLQKVRRILVTLDVEANF
jgi:hypothetical protein